MYDICEMYEYSQNTVSRKNKFVRLEGEIILYLLVSYKEKHEKTLKLKITLIFVFCFFILIKIANH